MSSEPLSDRQLAQALFFLDPLDRALLAPYFTQLEIGSGDELFGVGAPVEGLCFLLQGRLAVSKVNPLYGKAQVIGLLDPGAMVGETALLGPGCHRAEVRWSRRPIC